MDNSLLGTIVVAVLSTPVTATLGYLTARYTKRQEVLNAGQQRSDEAVWKIIAQLQSGNKEQADQIKVLETRVEELWTHRQQALDQLSAEQMVTRRLRAEIQSLNDRLVVAAQTIQQLQIQPQMSVQVNVQPRGEPAQPSQDSASADSAPPGKSLTSSSATTNTGTDSG